MNPARKAAITLVLRCCANEALHSWTNSTLGPNGAHQSSIEIAVDQRQHIGKARQIGAEFFSIFVAKLHGERVAATGNRRLTHDEVWRIAGDGTGASISRQIGCLLARIAFSEAQRRAEKAIS
jgi:pyruvate/2-oxoacid:ferredoxin oxidoreductase beta subunit